MWIKINDCSGLMHVFIDTLHYFEAIELVTYTVSYYTQMFKEMMVVQRDNFSPLPIQKLNKAVKLHCNHIVTIIYEIVTSM